MNLRIPLTSCMLKSQSNLENSQILSASRQSSQSPFSKSPQNSKPLSPHKPPKVKNPKPQSMSNAKITGISYHNPPLPTPQSPQIPTKFQNSKTRPRGLPRTFTGTRGRLVEQGRRKRKEGRKGPGGFGIGDIEGKGVLERSGMLVRNERSGVGGCGRREIILKSYLNCLKANKDIEVFKKPFSDLLSPNRTSCSKRKRKNKRKSLIPTRNTQSRKHLHATPLNPLSKSPPKAPHPFTPKTAPFKEPLPKTLLHESQRHQVLHKVYQQKEKGIVIEQFVKKAKMFRRGCEKEDRKDRCSFEKSEEDRNDELERMVKQSSYRDVSMVYANMKPKIMDGSVPEILERVRRVRKPKYLPKSQIFEKTKNSSKFLNTTLVIPKHPENPIPTSDYIKRGSGDNPSNPSFQTTSYKNPTILISLNPPKLNPKNTKKHSKVTFIPSKSS